MGNGCDQNTIQDYGPKSFHICDKLLHDYHAQRHSSATAIRLRSAASAGQACLSAILSTVVPQRRTKLEVLPAERRRNAGRNEDIRVP